MQKQLLASAILFATLCSAQSLSYNATNCAANKTAAFCSVTNDASTLPVCAGIYYYQKISATKSSSGNLGFYCLPFEAAENNTLIAYDSTTNFTINITGDSHNGGYYDSSFFVSCVNGTDNSCASNTCCASRSLGV